MIAYLEDSNKNQGSATPDHNVIHDAHTAGKSLFFYEYSKV